VKVYLTSGLEGITRDMVECDFEEKAFDLRIKGLKGKNLRFKAPLLENNVIPADCKFQVKSSSISITLKKKEKGNWEKVQGVAKFTGSSTFKNYVPK